jgi:sulfatase-modifying factor enzyme 1
MRPFLVAWVLAGTVASAACGVKDMSVADARNTPAPAAPLPRSSGGAPGAGGSSSPASVRALGSPRDETLPFWIEPVAGGKSALLVSSDLLRGQSYVRRIDARGVGPVRVLRGRQVAAALDVPRPLLFTSDGRRVCSEPLDAMAGPICHEIDPSFVVALGGRRVALVGERIEVPPEEQPPEPAPDGKKATKKKKKKEEPPHLRLWLQPLDAQGALDGDAIDLAGELPWAGPGMGLVGASSTPSGARLLWYELAPDRKSGSKRVPQANLKSAALDDRGALLEATRRLVAKGDRSFDHIDGQLDPRLVTLGDRAGCVVKKSQEDGGGFDLVRVEPGGGALGVPAALAATLPEVLLGRADQASLQALERIAAAGPRLAPEQSSGEAQRVAWAGDRAWWWQRDALWSAAGNDGNPRSEGQPFVAHRARIHWGWIGADGAGLAATADGLDELGADGSLAHHALDVDAALAQPIGRPARIGASWWIVRAATGPGSGGAVTRLLPAPGTAADLAPLALGGSSTLVGGREQGMLVALRGARLEAWRLGADGSTSLAAAHRSPLGHGFDGCERAGGGVLLAGTSATVPRKPMVIAIDAAGRLVGVHESSLPIRAGHVRIRPRPDGGAWVAAGDRVGWYDEDGREIAAAAWQDADSGAACVDGEAAPAWVPGVAAGSMLNTAAMASEGRCVVGWPAVMGDGAVRWFGASVGGIDSAAEVGSLPGTGGAPGSGAGTGTGTGGEAAPAIGKCPAEMVWTGGFCVDRFETQLVDAGSGVPVSPDFPLTGAHVELSLSWATGRWRTGDLHAQAMPLPPLLRTAVAGPQVVARSRFGVVPSGYLNAIVAKQACEAAGKRLCHKDEWITACRGELGRKFPYGNDYEHGACNVHRYAHPAATLHGNAAVGHLDPRLNRVTERDGSPLLLETGSLERCRSSFGDDGVYDMVGNLDEWVDDEKGAFAGGFYSRTTKAGCDAIIVAHPKRYLDYSLGARCCLTP